METVIFELDEPQIITAWLWLLLPLLATTITTVAIASSSTTPPDGTSIAILGPQESGKTQFLRTLQDIPYSNYEGTVGKVKEQEFKLKIGNKEYKIKKPVDLGGGVENIRLYYEDLIEEYDITIFIFDIRKYFSDLKYATDTRARLEFVHRKLTAKHPYPSVRNKKYIVFASHFDLLSKGEQKDALQKLQNSIKHKSYESMFTNNLLLCDLTNRTKTLELLNEKKYLNENNFMDSN